MSARATCATCDELWFFPYSCNTIVQIRHIIWNNMWHIIYIITDFLFDIFDPIIFIYTELPLLGNKSGYLVKLIIVGKKPTLNLVSIRQWVRRFTNRISKAKIIKTSKTGQIKIHRSHIKWLGSSVASVTQSQAEAKQRVSICVCLPWVETAGCCSLWHL